MSIGNRNGDIWSNAGVAMKLISSISAILLSLLFVFLIINTYYEKPHIQGETTMAIGNGSGDLWSNAGDTESPAGVKVNEGFITNGELSLDSGDSEVHKFFDSTEAAIYYKHHIPLGKVFTAYDFDTTSTLDWRGFASDGSRIVAVQSNLNSIVQTSDDGGYTWTNRNVLNARFRDVVYGNGKFVGVGSSGTASYSTNGESWTPGISAESNSWSSVTYGDSLFVAVSYDGTNRVMTSSDGINWTPRTAASNNTWRKVTYGDGLFVAVADNNDPNPVMTSPDGINWTSRAIPNSNWYGVAYGNGYYVAVGSLGSNNIMYSADAINWTIINAPADKNWTDITYVPEEGGSWIAVGSLTSSTNIMRSTNLTDWELVDRGIYNSSLKCVEYIDGKILTAGFESDQQMYISG